MDIVFRRCQILDNNGGGVFLVFGNLEQFVDAPVSILFEDCDIRFRDDCPGRPGRLSGLSVSHIKSILYGTFVWDFCMGVQGA